MSNHSHSASCIFLLSVPHPQHPDRLPILFAAQLGSVQGLFWERHCSRSQSTLAEQGHFQRPLFLNTQSAVVVGREVNKKQSQLE